MPTIEMHGQGFEECQSLIEEIKFRVADLDFRDQIVVQSVPGSVMELDGTSRPFIRIYTRQELRASALRDRLLDLVDIEVVYIEFFERMFPVGSGPNFESRLVSALEPINRAFTAFALYAFFDSGVAAALSNDSRTAAELSSICALAGDRLDALIVYLENEDFLKRDAEGRIGFTSKGQDIVHFEPWYRLLIGGYGVTLTQLSQLLANGEQYGARNVRDVAQGSCGISQYDAIPLLEGLLSEAAVRPSSFVDIGCGDGTFLLSVMSSLGVRSGVGLDADPNAIAAARRNASNVGAGGDVQFLATDAASYIRALDSSTKASGTCYVASFVLQEMLQQSGEEAVVDVLRAIAAHSPGAHVLVIEVEPRGVGEHMKNGLARAYYNPYFLIHRLTEQRLETKEFWQGLFDRAGLEVIGIKTTDSSVDSTGFEFGALLTPR
ncbi:methyltransferase domain-containing protein [Actinomycetospora cinnamomea]|uniref:2-ketoarginine methyltransferase n=1 Tax=Actinomycetospora cinnamomea TaxID=663609 RepID=A0A2U1F7R5_9PSEU|nr:methyltransferase domain-containing protein [Actinomycetospora cinnamomea]PVZ08214.1 2-ketoarginine methyltransferase [Actinomycetospora cinnamomea]